jgi:cupin fold WbuC family metalloprotein
MIIDKKILDELTEKAKASPRLRRNLDLRNSAEDQSQRMLNALEPGTIMPIHRHKGSSETCVCVRGHFEEYFYDADGNLTDTIDMVPRGVVLNIESPHQKCIAEIDTGMLRHVMMHLLTNAIRHTLQGSITIQYKQQDYGLYFAVIDTGEGIPEDLKNNIFALLNDKNTFVQQETPGLGLSICKSIIDAVHGHIGMTTEQGKGSTFWFWAPCKILSIQ